MSDPSFTGFTPDTFQFLSELRANNERDWFNANKDRYEAVREPGLALIRDIAKPLSKVSPFFTAVAKKSGGSMMRIYRDVRFSKSKLPYKTNLGIQFRHESGKDVHAPGFYFHIAPDEIFFGAGMWQPANDRLADIRRQIDDDPARWKRIVNRKAFRETFDRVGDSLKRKPRDYDIDHPLIEDLKRKDHIGATSLSRSEVLDRKLIQTLTAHMKTSLPFVRFLCDALHLPA
jgi:uncharacterized protein (TIGR02453 family)